MRKKILGTLLCVAMVSTMITGCGNNDNSKTGTTEKDTKKESETKGSVYYLNFKPEQAEAWEELAETYTDQTGVKVIVETAASGTYEKTLKSEMAKSKAPTMFQVNGPVGLASWKDYCYDLSTSSLKSNLKSDEFALKGNGEEVFGIAYVIETYGIIYNKKLLADYCALDGAVISSEKDINSFEVLKKVAEDMQKRKEDLGIQGAFTSAGMDSSSDWRFKTHLANLPIYYEYQKKGITSAESMEGTYLDNYKQIWDLYIQNATCKPSLLSSKTGEDAVAEFASGDAVFFQNGTWAYGDITNDGLTDEDLGMLPIYIGAPGEERQGLCTGSENYWCVNKKASKEDIEATLKFMDWVITSKEGRDSLANKMGFVTPFSTFDDGYTTENPLIKAADAYIAEGKIPVSWNFSTIPSENWKNNVGSALLEYAQGTGEWDGVEKAFVDGWALEYKAIQGK